MQKRIRTFKTLAFFGLLFVVTKLLAQSAAPFEPRVVLPDDPDTVVISYTETPDMLGNPDTTPRIQVFADGRVLVHYPIYMKRAGDYEMYLNPGELRRLVLEASGVIGFDKRQAAQARRQEQQARSAVSGTVTARSDEVLDSIILRLDGFQGSAAASMGAVNERAEWRDAAYDAVEFPGVPGIIGFAKARDSLRALLEHPDLLLIQGPPMATRQLGGDS